jgi:molybdate transport system substrate-binding protein
VVVAFLSPEFSGPFFTNRLKRATSHSFQVFKEEETLTLNSRMKKLALGLSAALVMVCSPADAEIEVAVAASFAKTANDIVGAFQAYYFDTYGLNYDVGLTVSDAQSLETQIINGPKTMDLFLSSSKNEPEHLEQQYRHLVSSAPFVYARDGLELYSISVDITGGLPYPLTVPFVIPDPTHDNYGAAAAQILQSRPWKIATSSIPSSLVVTRSDVGVALSAVRHGNFGYGFVARSQICQYANGVDTYPAGSYHHEYKSHDPAHPFDAELLHLTGIEIAKTRTTDQATELKDFVSFLRGTRNVHGVATSIGTSLIQGYCFGLPDRAEDRRERDERF